MLCKQQNYLNDKRFFGFFDLLNFHEFWLNRGYPQQRFGYPRQDFSTHLPLYFFDYNLVFLH